MSRSNIRRVTLYLVAVCLSGCHACNSKTPVPFKREPPTAANAHDAGAPAEPAEAKTEAATYPEGTQKIRVSETTIERPEGVIYASLALDVDADKQPDALIVSSDAQGKAKLEVILHDSARASGELALAPEPVHTGCRAVGAQVTRVAEQLGLASVDYLCDPVPPPSAAGPGTAGALRNALGAALAAAAQATGLAQPAAAQANGTAQPAAAPGQGIASPVPAQPLAPIPGQAPAPAPTPDPAPAPDEAPPEPSNALAMTQYFLFSLEGTRPVLRLRLCADWAGRNEPLGSEFVILGSDIDGDQQPDVQAALQMTEADDTGTPAKQLLLTWLNRPTGLARERSEPEATLTALAQEAYKRAQKSPRTGLPIAERALRLHQLLCKESGAAELWTDDARGLACGPSNGAGKAAAAAAIAHAQNQSLLPALDARALLDDPMYVADKKTREQVNQAIGSIRGDTSYRWIMGPTLRPASAPSLHLPLIGFIDENSLLLRGPTLQSYDLASRALTPTGLTAGGVLAGDPQSRFVLTEIVRNCDGYHVRTAPFGRVIGGVVTGPIASEPLLSPPVGVTPGDCAGVRPHSERGGYVLLGMLPNGALFAHGRRLFRLPFDAQGQFGEAAEEVPSQAKLPPLQSPGALDQSARYFALAVSEGVALIDRVQNSARLVRTPASCAGGQVSDAVLSPSAHKLAMLCGGRVYVAEPAAASGTGDRPISETP